MKEFIFAIFLSLNCVNSVLAGRSGEQCNSQFGEGLCTPITQCKLLPRIKRLGHIPTMCGFDSNGPIMCCPKYSHNLQIPKSNLQRLPETKRPDLSFDHEMQGDQPLSNQGQNANIYNSEDKQPKYNKYNEQLNGWNRDDEYSVTSASSWANNGGRKTTHYRPYDRPDVSTSRYPSHTKENFRPDKRPSFESNSYETNDFRPITGSFSSNHEESSWNNNNNNNNRPYTSNEWSNERPSSFNNPSSNRPTLSNNVRPSGFGSGSNFGSTQTGVSGIDNEDRPVWGVVQQKTTTNRPQSSSSQNSWSRPKRISQIKCKEYNEDRTDSLRPLPLLPNPDVIPVSGRKCDLDAVALIVGGTDTTIGEFPHMAAIGFQSRGNLNWNCGGTLISNEYVLTAAHCTHSAEGQPVRVRLGDWDMDRTDDVVSEDYRVSRIIVHPQYSKQKKYNDIALLQLDRRVQFNKNIRPACLFDNDNLPVNKFVATGWGRVETAGAKGGILKKVELPMIDNRKCNELYLASGSEASLNNGITSNMLCAGEWELDTCLGDSGGPLQFTDRENRCIYHIVGVTSFGKTMCGQRNSPGVYTRVSSFVPWIESVVWPNE